MNSNVAITPAAWLVLLNLKDFLKQESHLNRIEVHDDANVVEWIWKVYILS